MPSSFLSMTFWRTGRRVMLSPSDSRWRVSPGASCKRSRRGLGRTTRPALSRVSLVVIMASWSGRDHLSMAFWRSQKTSQGPRASETKHGWANRERSSGTRIGTFSKSREASDSGEPVKTRIKAQDSLDSMLLHDGQVHGVTGGHLSASHHNLFRAFGCGPVYGQHFIGDAKQSVECGLDGVAPVYRHIAVEYLLQDLGIRDQALPVGDEVFQQTLRVGLVRMGSANEVHRDVRVDQNQGCVPGPYPLSISASIRPISAEGKSCRAAARITSSFFPTPAPGSRRRARSRAWRTHSAMDMRRERATRWISRYSGSFRITCSRLAMAWVYLTHAYESRWHLMDH